ncbi:hypothetical protein SJA_C1-09940 [Sphingobium indicum UT26S]|uniref:Uncharacterized protein n=1 Tax=Sphingobium indicum (strain DSM 16413 / CCM 7287 / MTCC 6362 / UT26 / NBRC 101211 / UT26S) TaxID=452662 RepID=D4YZP6_SPHIU|nr:hypothetical protein SJA_C1-09940 [Sphingobium indicum UT26S]
MEVGQAGAVNDAPTASASKAISPATGPAMIWKRGVQILFSRGRRDLHIEASSERRVHNLN